jgi:hypothetical protein
MSDDFETRPGGGQRQEAGGGPEDATAVDFDDVEPAEGEASSDVLGADVLGADVLGDDDFGNGRGVPAWVGAVTGAALGLVAVQALILLGTLTQALAVERFQGDTLHKVGIALLSNVGSANGLTLLVAAVAAALPAFVGAPVAEMHRRRQALVFGIGAVLAVLLVLGTPLAVRARIHVLDAGGQGVDSLARRVLATYVAGTLGTALVALGACLGLSRYSKTVTPRP